MPSFYIFEQVKRNTLKILECLWGALVTIWSFIDKFSTKFANGFNKQIIGRITRKANKHKKCLKIFCIILAVLGLITGLFMGSFKSAGAREQGLQINYTEQTFKEKYYTNDWKYTGLNGYMEVVPKQNIMIEFTNEKSAPEEQLKTHQIYQAIEARVIEGTKLQIEASIQCKIVLNGNKDTSMKQFFDNFGFKQTAEGKGQLQWMTYLRWKIYNIIVQTISKYSFYSISKKGIKDTINNQFTSLYQNYNDTFPFMISVLSLSIKYPDNSFSVNNTLGVQLLKAKSILNQLEKQYNKTQIFVGNTSNRDQISQIYAKNAILSANIDSNLLNIVSFNEWRKGIQLTRIISNQSTWPQSTASLNATNTEKYLWLYFNNLYNSTYRQQKLSKLLNESNYEKKMYLEQQLSLY